MPTTNSEIKDAVSKLFGSCDDPATIKKLGEIEALIDTKQKEDDVFLEKHKTLVKDYRDAVMNASLPPQHNQDETGADGNKSKSLEDVISEVLTSKGEK